MVIIIGSSKPVIVSRASETHCGPAKICFGWPDWPAREKVKHDHCSKGDINMPIGELRPLPIIYAVYHGNVQCAKKLIQKGTRFYTTDHKYDYAWGIVVGKGNVELLKCMFDIGFDKDWTDDRIESGRRMLSHLVPSGNVEAIRFLLDHDVTVSNYTPTTNEMTCKDCGKNRQLLGTLRDQRKREPCFIACEMNMLPVVQLLAQGRMQDFSGGGAQLQNFWDFGYTCREAACREQRAFARGVWGHSPPRKIFKNGAISCVLKAILNHFHGKKSSQKIINKHEFFH